MKKLPVFALLSLLVPVLSFGQRFEISEMAGVSKDAPPNYYFGPSPGYSNQLSFSYYFTKHLSIGAFHDFNNWTPSTNSFGLLADAHFRHFYFGVNVAEEYIGTKTVLEPNILEGYIGPWPIPSNMLYYSLKVKLNPAISSGAHFGLNQKLSKRFIIKEQIGFSYGNTKGAFMNDSYNFRILCYSVLAGISYRF